MVHNTDLHVSGTEQCLGSHAGYIGIVMRLYSFSIDTAEVFTYIDIQQSGFSQCGLWYPYRDMEAIHPHHTVRHAGNSAPLLRIPHLLWVHSNYNVGPMPWSMIP